MNLTPGQIAGLVGVVMGIVGGAAGSLGFWKRANKSPRALRFVIRSAIVWVAFVASFLVTLILVPSSRKPWVCVGYLVVHPFLLRATSREETAIAQEAGEGDVHR